MSKIDLIIDALSVAQNSVWSKLNEEALAAARKLQADLAKPEQKPVRWFQRFGDTQPEQEPVAWMVRDQVDGCRYPSASKNPAGSINGESQPLYTAPSRKEWVGLTDEERNRLKKYTDEGFAAGALWAEANLKELNT